MSSDNGELRHDLRATEAERHQRGKFARGRSLVVAGRESGLRASRVATAVTAALEAYQGRMHHYAFMPELDIWYDGTHVNGLRETRCWL